MATYDEMVEDYGPGCACKCGGEIIREEGIWCLKCLKVYKTKEECEQALKE